MTDFLNEIESLGKVVAQFAPTIGALLPIPGAQIIGEAVAKAFGGDIKSPTDLISLIQQDENAQAKLGQIESNVHIGMKPPAQPISNTQSTLKNNSEVILQSNRSVVVATYHFAQDSQNSAST